MPLTDTIDQFDLSIANLICVQKDGLASGRNFEDLNIHVYSRRNRGDTRKRMGRHVLKTVWSQCHWPNAEDVGTQVCWCIIFLARPLTISMSKPRKNEAQPKRKLLVYKRNLVFFSFNLWVWVWVAPGRLRLLLRILLPLPTESATEDRQWAYTKANRPQGPRAPYWLEPASWSHFSFLV